MSDDGGEFLETLRTQMSTIMTTTAARRSREIQAVHPDDRRTMRAIRTPPEHVRSMQLNLRISPRFKQRIVAAAIAQNVSVTEILVRAFDAYAAKK